MFLLNVTSEGERLLLLLEPHIFELYVTESLQSVLRYKRACSER